MAKTLIINAAQIATPIGFHARHGAEMNSLRVLDNGAIVVENGIITAVDDFSKLRNAINDTDEYEILDASGCCLIPGFVDSHTHVVFGGYRPQEFMERVNGTPYLEILNHGGGIQDTVQSTRRLSENALTALTLQKLDDMLEQGVTTVESKSGYGLDTDTELMQLRVNRNCLKSHPITLISTYLGAHAIPQEYQHRSDAYIDRMIHTVLPEIKAHHLAEFCDVFCEDSVFSVTQAQTLLTAAKSMGFGLKIHADEILSLGGAELACALGAVSADHLLAVSERGIQMLSKSNTVATLLPNTAFCLKKPYAPAKKMLDAGCALALATDFNPGSCYTDSIPLLFALAVLQMGISPEAALTALTLNGAAALNRADRIGSLEPGKQADILFLKSPDYRFLVYNTCKNQVKKVMKNGKLVYQSHG